MAHEECFEITKDGTVKSETPLAALTPALAKDDDLGIEHIYDMIKDPEVPISDISRQIALAIVNVMKKMSPKDVLSRGVGPSQRDLNDQIKGYRELQRTLTEGDALSKKDVLSLDGEKFKFVFSTLIQLFRKALEGGGVDEQVTQNVILQFGDLVRANEANLRIELNKIGNGR